MSKFFTSVDTNLEIRLGNIPNRRAVTMIGHAEAIGTAFSTVMPGTSASSISPAALIATPAAVKVASESANDTSAGTGARTVLLYGLDADGIEQSETITLNGQTEVTSANTYKFIHGLTVLTAGSGATNASNLWVGTGTFTSGVPATKLCSMEAETNQSALGAYMIPTGYRYVPAQLVWAMGDGASGRFFEANLFVRPPTTGLYNQAFSVHLPAGEHIQDIIGYPALPAGTVVEARAKVSAGTAAITVALAGYLVKE